MQSWITPKVTRARKSTSRHWRGTMPPGSNHFGMQIGGASLVLLAVTGERWADQRRIDTLLRVAEQSMVRNVSEGFGDGGFFAEADSASGCKTAISPSQ